jgi:nucleoside-diphosphate-sugar epimerase
MRVALTGANGFTGQFVTAALEQAGATSVPLSVDLTDPAAVDRAISAADFDRVIHLAGKAFVDASDWKGFYAVNQLGTFHLLDAVARHRPGARCVLASSAQVYGPGAQGLIAEDAPTNPANHYAVSKLAMEWGARRWDNQLELCATRLFNYTGVGQGTEYLIPKIVSHFKRHAEVIELGNLWVKRDFGDVRAVAEAYVGLITADTPPPATLNVATGTLWSIDDMLDVLAELSGYRPEVKVNPAFVRENDVEVLGGDATRLHATLPDWRPRDLTDTLGWMLQAPA